MKPLFSIVVPTLNEERYLPKLLTSLTEQSEQDFEVIICDGDSQDRTLKIAKRFSKNFPLTLVEHAPRAISRQRNLGSREAKGKWIVTADADTLFLPHCLARVKTFLKEGDPNHLTSWFGLEGDNPNDALIILLLNAGIEMSIKMKRPAAYGAFMVTRKDTFESVGGYDESLEFGEDNDLCKKIYEKTGKMMVVIREGLITYSLRRYHSLGGLHMLQTYARASFILLLTRRTPAKLPGYPMGGHVYTEAEERRRKSLLSQYEKTLKEFMKELME